MKFKVGDKVRIKGTEPVGVVDEIGGLQHIEFEHIRLTSYALRAEGFELEFVEPALPEEPETGSVVSFVKYGIVAERRNNVWYRIADDKEWSWAGLMAVEGADFEILRSTKEVAAGIADFVESYGPSGVAYDIRKKFKVES